MTKEQIDRMQRIKSCIATGEARGLISLSEVHSLSKELEVLRAMAEDDFTLMEMKGGEPRQCL